MTYNVFSGTLNPTHFTSERTFSQSTSVSSTLEALAMMHCISPRSTLHYITVLISTALVATERIFAALYVSVMCHTRCYKRQFVAFIFAVLLLNLLYRCILPNFMWIWQPTFCNDISSRLSYNYFWYGSDRPPYWNSTSGFDFNLPTVIGISFCIGTPNFMRIGPSAV